MSNLVYDGQFTPFKDDQDGLMKIHADLESKFLSASSYRHSLGINSSLKQAWYAMRREYSPEQLCKLQKPGSPVPVKFGLFSMQRASALAHHADLMRQAQEQPWTLEPTPDPNLPAKIRNEVIEAVTNDIIAGGDGTMGEAEKSIAEHAEVTQRMKRQKAAAIARKHSVKIHDQLVEGEWPKTMHDFLADFYTYPNAYILAPEAAMKTMLDYSGDKVVEKDRIVYSTRTISPFNVFFMPDCTDTQDGEGFFIVDEVAANTLYAMKTDDLCFEENIDYVLESHHENGWWIGSLVAAQQNEEAHNSFLDIRGLSGSDDVTKTFSVVRYFGAIRTQDLIDAGLMKGAKKDKVKPVTEVEIWICGGKIIRAAIQNAVRMGRPLHTASFRKLPRSVYGIGLWDILKDLEKTSDKTLRELVKHSELATGFFGELDVMRAGKSQNSTGFLNKIVPIDTDYTRGGHSALKFHQIDSKIPHIMSMLDNYMSKAEDLTGIRRFMSGSQDLSSAVRTSGVMNALMQNSSKLIQLTQDNINEYVIKQVIGQYYLLNMLYSKDKSIKGDLQVIIRGTDGLQKREMFSAQMEKLLQYGSSWASQVDASTGQSYIDPRDFRQLIIEWFKTNGYELAFTLSPSEQSAISQNPAALGTGGMAQIDGRSNPAPVGVTPQIQPQMSSA